MGPQQILRAAGVLVATATATATIAHATPRKERVAVIDLVPEVAGATIFVDGRPASAHVVLPAGPHVIAATAGTRRGYATGTVVKTQKTLPLPMPDQAGAWAAVAHRVASWDGKLPAPAE